ncbi:MAG: hypothetical protein ABJG15_00940 [Hyphomonadaceae bacterium]
MKDTVEHFLRDRLHFELVPKDLQAILAEIVKEPEFVASDRNPLQMVGAELLWSGKTTPLLDHDYLNDRDRADIYTMSNVSAMRDTAAKLSLFLVQRNRSLLGYWPVDLEQGGPSQTVFELDTEGQYRIGEGPTLAETLCYRFILNESPSQFEAMAKMFKALGIQVPYKSVDKIYADMVNLETKIDQSPQAYRSARYDHYVERAKR